MNVVSWSPFREMEDLFGRYRQLANRLPAAGENGGSALRVDWRPIADISESKDEYLIKAELPAVDRDDINVSVDGGRVTIHGERKMEKEDEDTTRHRVESFYGSFSRTFALPENADTENISAKSKNGVLKVRIPKLEQSKPKAIEVAVK